jgi:co-chaperonin GroES (HSP10)
MKSEETLNNDTISNLNLIGDRILIQLKEIQNHTRTEAGLYIPANVLAETDGGKVTTRPSGQKYYAEGTILNISQQATEKLIEDNKIIPRNFIGDTVLIAKHTLNNDSFHFYVDRSKQVQDFKGVILIPHTLIEAIITK